MADLFNLSGLGDELVQISKGVKTWESKLTRFEQVAFTVVEEETYTYSNDVTTKPLEDNSVVSDHVQNKPIIIHITGIITGKGKYPQERLDLLRKYCIQGTVGQYYGIQTLWNFVITNLENKHTADVGNGCAFTMDLQQVLTARKEVVNILTSDITIPDIEALKSQLSSSSTSSSDVVHSRVVAPTRTGKQTKQAVTTSSSATSSSVIESIVQKFKGIY